MVWQDYLSLLTWQTGKICMQDFENLEKANIKCPQDILPCISNPETQTWLYSKRFWWKQAEEDYKKCQKKNYKLTWPGKQDYPRSFLRLNKPPVTLTYIGELCQDTKHFPMTIVGSRKYEDIVFNWLDFYLPEVIRKHAVCLVSGGARGVDQKVHSIAIRLKQPTLCFIPSGLDKFYPQSLQAFRRDVLDHGGAFISSFHPDSSMYKSFFHIRNQLMAAYSELVLVAQASLRSGTMLTALKALNHGIPVGVLPGPALSRSWTGNLQLLYDGAYLIRDDKDLSLLIESLKNIL